MKTRAVLLVVASIAAGAWADATINGRVTRPNGAALSGIQVEAHRFNGDWWQYVDSVSTDMNGQYSLGVLTAGDYRVRFRDWSGLYIGEWYDDAINEDDAATITLADNQTVDQINARLTRGSIIVGVVTNAAGDPLENMQVEAYRYNGSWWDQVANSYTDADGRYQVAGLTAGKYRIKFRDYDGLYASEWYDNIVLEGESKLVPVPPLAIVSNINASMGPAGSIAGTVFGPGAVPLMDIDVSVYIWNNDYWDNLEGGYTDASGNYVIGGLPAGQFIVRFRDWQGAYATEWYSNVVNRTDAMLISLSAGSSKSNINATLASAARISGIVTAQDGVTPLGNIDVSAQRWNGSDWEWASSESTDPSGRYSIGALPAGQYRVEFRDWAGTYSGQWFSNSVSMGAASTVTLAESGIASNVNASLSVGARITGTVTTTNGVTPIAGVYVAAYRQAGSEWDWMGYDYSGQDGVYDIGGLATGVYRVGFWPDADYQEEYYDNQTDSDAATPIPVPTITTIANINAALTPSGASGAGSISGVVTGPDGTTPLLGAYVNLYVPQDGGWVYETTVATMADGSYVLGGLAAGTNLIQFMDPSEVLVAEWYSQSPDMGGAMPLILMPGQQLTGIDATLEAVPQTGISGVVTEIGSGNPLEGIRVELWMDAGLGWSYESVISTESDGSFRFTDLTPGIYRIQFYDTGGFYVSEYFDNTQNWDDAAGIVVSDGNMTAGIDAELDPVPQTGLSGRVGAAGSGIPLAGLVVTLYYDFGGGWAPSHVTTTDSDGRYTFIELWEGMFRVEFVDTNGIYRAEFYDNQEDVGSATDVSVLYDLMTTGIDAELDVPLSPVPAEVVGIKRSAGNVWEVYFVGGVGSAYILQHAVSPAHDWGDSGSSTNCVEGTNILKGVSDAAPGIWRIRKYP